MENTKSEKKAAPQFFKKFLTCAAINAFSVLSLLFFAPLEIYLGNAAEFLFPLESAAAVLIILSLAVIAVVSAVEAVLPLKIYAVLNSLSFALGLCSYIQAMFLNGSMSSLTGEKDTYSLPVVLINAAVWLLIFAAAVAFVLIYGKKHGNKALSVIKYISLALVVMQGVALCSLRLSADPAELLKTDYLSQEGRYELAEDENVVVFIVDTCDGRVVSEALADYPDLFDNMNGFTYFPNCTSTYSRTYPSVPFLLTGENCYFDIPYTDYVNSAFEKSTFLPSLKNIGCDIRIFTANSFIGDAAKPIISNYLESDVDLFSSVSFFSLGKQMLKISLYREAPYFAKSRFFYDIGIVNRAVCRLPDKNIPQSEGEFYEGLKASGLSLGDYQSAFRFYHFNGVHSGSNIDENGIVVGSDNTTASMALRGDFRIIEKYIEEMQNLGIYENSTIIISADHGNSGGGEILEQRDTACPLLLVKPAGRGADDEFMVSDAPVCQGDLFNTVYSGYEAVEKSGDDVFDISENDSRVRYYYYSALYSDTDGEIVLRQYAINGDSRDFENWELTGENFDIVYSMNKVSSEQFEG